LGPVEVDGPYDSENILEAPMETINALLGLQTRMIRVEEEAEVQTNAFNAEILKMEKRMTGVLQEAAASTQQSRKIPEQSFGGNLALMSDLGDGEGDVDMNASYYADCMGQLDALGAKFSRFEANEASRFQSLKHHFDAKLGQSKGDVEVSQLAEAFAASSRRFESIIRDSDSLG